MMQRKLCGCGRVDKYSPSCPSKNIGLKIDFGALLKMIEEMKKHVECENRSGKRKTRIFVAPVIRGRKKKREEGMRKAERIPKILKRLERLWKKHPDLRLSQLINNVFRFQREHLDSPDLYYMEDDNFLNFLEKYYKSR